MRRFLQGNLRMERGLMLYDLLLHLIETFKHVLPLYEMSYPLLVWILFQKYPDNRISLARRAGSELAVL